jgi:hypothetical protein
MTGLKVGGGIGLLSARAASIRAALAFRTSAKGCSGVSPKAVQWGMFGDVGKVTAVLFAVKDVDVVLRHPSPLVLSFTRDLERVRHRGEFAIHREFYGCTDSRGAHNSSLQDRLFCCWFSVHKAAGFPILLPDT